MHAAIREMAYDPEKLARGTEQRDEFWQLRARQPGYRGALIVEAEGGRSFVVTLWETPEQYEAAQATLQEQGQRLLTPLFAAPVRHVVDGPVVYDDITQS